MYKRQIPRRVIRVACPSAGDAAMAARALDIEGCSFCGLSSAPGAGKDPAGVVKRVFGKAPDVPDCVLVCVAIKILRRDLTEGRRDACSMAWRCRFLTVLRSRHGRVIAEK